MSELTPVGLVGPTASGKSAVAIALAERLGGEIISVDSMQVYRGLDIGTAKPSREEQARVPHHLIDVSELTEPFDAARFVQLAGNAITEIQQRGRIPIFCGGTGLYLQAYCAGLGSAPAPDPRLRAELEAAPIGELLAELDRADPTTFKRIDQRNPRRVIRALEVIRLTGRPYSELRAHWTETPRQLHSRIGPVFGLTRDGVDLRQRMNARVDAMFRAGLVRETDNAVSLGLEGNRTARQAIGYRQVLEHLRGERDLAATVLLVKIRSWQYARRQMTWFRKHLPVTWLRLESDDPMDRVLELLFRAWPDTTQRAGVALREHPGKKSG